jgi:membrane protease YdiL (CAAX protease family)
MKKFLSLIEVLLVFILIKPLGWWLVAIGVYEWEVKNLGGWSYLGGLLLYLVPLLILAITRRDFRGYGITCKHWRQSLDLAMHVFPIKLLPWFLGIAAIFILNQDYTDISVALILTGGYVLAIILLFLSLNRYQHKPEPGRKTTLTNIVVLAAITFAPIIISLSLGRFSGRVASTVLWQVVFSGFGEELKWRGYFQSRLNRGFGRPYLIYGVQFGPGLLITALLFGISHGLNTFNPLIGNWSFQWEWALFTLFSGLFFGIIREKSQDIIAPGILHGVPDAFGEAIGIIFGIGNFG